MSGCVPCITPASRLWLRRRQRWLIGVERMALQGFNMDTHAKALSEISEPLQCKLAGNAFSFHCFSISFVSALATLPLTWLDWLFWWAELMISMLAWHETKMKWHENDLMIWFDLHYCWSMVMVHCTFLNNYDLRSFISHAIIISW